MARKITIAIHKGGVGKTTTAKNLAAALALTGKRTLLVDMDEQANATKGLGVDPMTLKVTLNHLFANPDIDPTTALLATSLGTLHILPGHPDLANTERGMALQRADPNAIDPINSLRELLAPLEDYYDYMVIDTPPSLNYMTINALAAADDVLIPAAASAYTEDGVAKTWEAVERARNGYNRNLRPPHILITRLKRTNASGMVQDVISEAYQHRVMPQVIVESTLVDEAEQLGQPVVIYAPDSPAAQGYIRVAEILVNGQ